MTDPSPAPLALVVCGAPLSARTAEVARQLRDVGWPVRVVATHDAMAWVDVAAVEEVTGFPPLVEQRQPPQAKRFPPPGRVIVCPATFNTLNKLAAGIADTYAHGFLCEALASGTPMTVVPMVSTKLSPHPAWSRTLDTLAGAGVSFLDVNTGRLGRPEPTESGTGDQVVAAFKVDWITEAIGTPAQKS
jgi:phosphopantothenoylcysteine synthetase/decarboxylase